MNYTSLKPISIDHQTIHFKLPNLQMGIDPILITCGLAKPPCNGRLWSWKWRINRMETVPWIRLLVMWLVSHWTGSIGATERSVCLCLPQAEKQCEAHCRLEDGSSQCRANERCWVCWRASSPSECWRTRVAAALAFHSLWSWGLEKMTTCMSMNTILLLLKKVLPLILALRKVPCVYMKRIPDSFHGELGTPETWAAQWVERVTGSFSSIKDKVSLWRDG